MFCTSCGQQNAAGTGYCTNCGAQLLGWPVSEDSSASAARQAMSGMPHVGQGQSQAQMGGVPSMPPSPQPTGASVSAAPSPSRGCFGSAWDDVTHSPGWFRKLLFMALVELVPILNWVNFGYAYNWGRNVAFGIPGTMPKKLVTSENFKSGAIIFLIALVAGIAWYAQTWLISYCVISAFGVRAATVAYVISAVFSVFFTMFLTLAFARSAVFGTVGAGFSVGRIMAAYRRKLGTVFAITFLPALVASAFSVLVSFVAVILVGVVVGTGGMAMLQGLYYYDALGYAPAANALGGATVALFIVAFVYAWIVMLLGVLSTVLTGRAAGYYVARHVPEWTDEAQQPGAGTVAAQSPGASSLQGWEVALRGGGSSVAGGAAAQGQNAAFQGAGQAASVTAEPARQPKHAAPSPLPYDDDPGTVVSETMVGGTFVSDSIVDFSWEPQQRVQAEGTVVLEEPLPASPSPAPSVTPAPTAQTSGSASAAEEPAQVQQSAPAAAPRLRLTRTDGSECVISSFPATIGRDEAADVCIADNPKLSREHARILYDSGVFAVEDLGSPNHTYVQGYLVEPNNPTILSNGDELKLATEILRVRVL